MIRSWICLTLFGGQINILHLSLNEWHLSVDRTQVWLEATKWVNDHSEEVVEGLCGMTRSQKIGSLSGDLLETPLGIAIQHAAGLTATACT